MYIFIEERAWRARSCKSSYTPSWDDRRPSRYAAPLYSRRDVHSIRSITLRAIRTTSFYFISYTYTIYTIIDTRLWASVWCWRHIQDMNYLRKIKAAKIDHAFIFNRYLYTYYYISFLKTITYMFIYLHKYICYILHYYTCVYMKIIVNAYSY